MSIEIQAPNKIISLPNHLKIFLGGSIEMGKAIEWQRDFITKLKDKDFIFLNPRRDDWDSTWKQDITNKNFREQVEWELDALEQSDIIVMFFDPNTKSPISLLELGLHSHTGKLLVCCPEGFWRKGNVDIVCEKYYINQYNTISDIIDVLMN